MKKFWNWVHDDSGGRVLRLEGPIDSENFWGDEITPQDFRSELEAGDGDVTVWINSPGGNVFAAAEIYTMLKDYAGQVTVKVASLAASAASVVAMAGDVVQMSPTALLMLHDPSTVAMGNARDMEKAISTLNEVKESIVNAYAAKSGLRRGRIADAYMKIITVDRVTAIREIAARMQTTYASAADNIQKLIDAGQLCNAYIYHRDGEVIVPGISRKQAWYCRSCGGTTVLYANDTRMCEYCGAALI